MRTFCLQRRYKRNTLIIRNDKKMLRTNLFLILSLLIGIKCLATTGDSTQIKFNSEVIDFHFIYEADGAIPIEFEYTNSGEQPLKINRIIAPGFKNITFSKSAILPGQKEKIRMQVDPFGKSGYFEKKIIVFNNTINSPNELLVKGKIVNGTYKSSFNAKIGDLGFKQLQLNFGYIYDGDIAIRYIPVINNSDENMEISFGDIPDHLEITKKFKILSPSETGLIEIRYNTTVLNDWDFIIDKINIIVKGNKVDSGTILISANIRENFLLLTENDKLNTPKASMPIKVHNYDTIPSGSIVHAEFPIYNQGNRDLNIRTVKPTCGCTAVLPTKNIIPPGDSTIIIVEFNSLGFSGNNKKGVTVISNDPSNYKQFLWISGFIE